LARELITTARIVCDLEPGIAIEPDKVEADAVSIIHLFCIFQITYIG